MASCCNDEITLRNSSAPTREKDGIVTGRGGRDGDLDPDCESSGCWYEGCAGNSRRGSNDKCSWPVLGNNNGALEGEREATCNVRPSRGNDNSAHAHLDRARGPGRVERLRHHIRFVFGPLIDASSRVCAPTSCLQSRRSRTPSTVRQVRPLPKRVSSHHKG